MTFDKILEDKRLWAVKYDLEGFNDYLDYEEGN